MQRKMSQREAHEWKRKAIRLQNKIENMNWSMLREWPSSAFLRRISASETTVEVIKTARKLGHGVTVLPADSGTDILLFGVKVND